MSEEKICGIYYIENIKNYKKYIGQSIDIKKRWYLHEFELNNNSHHNQRLQNAWNKYGEENFEFKILLECKREELDLYEQYFIEKFNTYYDGYNLDFGGTNRVRWTDEMRKKMSILKSNITEEHRQLCRIAHADQAIPIYQIDFDGNIVNQWMYGAREASKKLDIDQACIWNCVNNKRKTYKGYIWIACDRYDKNTFNPRDYITHKTCPASYDMYTVDGTLLKHFDSYSELSENGLDPSSVLKCCNGKLETYKGYVFRKTY